MDLNVQAAWDQGITGKNVTTAIMDDGMYKLYIGNNKAQKAYLKKKKLSSFWFIISRYCW